MVEPRFAGEVVTLGGTAYTVPPLSLAGLKASLPAIQRIAVSPDGDVATPLEHLDDLFDICYAALRRNYPGLARAELDDLIEPGELQPLVRAVIKLSGLAAVQEKNGAAVASPSTGPASTAASPPPSAGAGSTSTST
jgi:hypothetical protein